MYQSIRGFYVLEVGLLEVPIYKLKDFFVLGHDVLLLEKGNLLSNAVQQLHAFCPFEVYKLLKGRVLLTILEVGELVAIEVQNIPILVEPLSQSIEVDQRDEDDCVFDQHLDLLHL